MALSRIVNGLLAQGIKHTIVVLKGEALIRDQFDPAVDIHCFHARADDLGVALRFRRLIRDIRPSVIHARNLGAWPEVALGRLGVWPPVPLVFSFHGVAEAKPLPWRWRMLCRLLARLTSHVFTVSHGAKQFLTAHVGLPPARIEVIPNGVDTARFFPQPKPAERPVCTIGTLGSLAPVKNQAMLVRACHRLAQEGIDLRLEIAGEGPERAALESLVQSLGMADKVRLPGHIADTPAFLHTLDVFALPSDSEAHPNALSEAMACGLPCIGSRVGGIPEILAQGRAGLIVERGDEAGLAAGLKTLLGDPALRQRLGAAAWDYTCEHYSMTGMLARYRQLYLRLSAAAPASDTP